MTDRQDDRQPAVLDLLSDPSLHGGATPKRIETHANFVVVGPDHAYKIKRAIKYPFLDYSTLPLREKNCGEEVRLNRRTAPGLYLGVRKVIEGPEGSLSCVDPEVAGDAVEWVVQMRAFDEATLFDRLAEAGKLSDDLLRDLAVSIAEFHRSADPAAADWGTAFRAVVDENLQELADAALWEPSRVAAMQAACGTLFDRFGPLLDGRAHDGKICDCHGDLHLRNICLIEGRPTLFDCIEFNPAFARIDVLYDLAFLIMDLEHRNMRAQAARVWNRYLEATADYEGAGLMALYKATRAQIRAKIEAATAQLSCDAAQAAEHRAEADRYFRLAETALRSPAPVLFAVGGASGSGKSTLARALAPQVAGGAVVLRTDAIRKELWGVALRDRLPQEAYATAVSQRVYALMEARAKSMLRQGVTVIADATFTHPDSRRRVEALAAGCGVPFHGIWLDAPGDVLKDRVAARAGDASDATPAVVARQLQDDWGVISWSRFDSRVDGRGSAFVRSVLIELGLLDVPTIE